MRSININCSSCLNRHVWLRSTMHDASTSRSCALSNRNRNWRCRTIGSSRTWSCVRCERSTIYECVSSGASTRHASMSTITAAVAWMATGMPISSWRYRNRHRWVALCAAMPKQTIIICAWTVDRLSPSRSCSRSHQRRRAAAARQHHWR